MSWQDYYRLLKKYDGDLRQATKEERNEALAGNPNDPASALMIAERKYLELKTKEVKP